MRWVTRFAASFLWYVIIAKWSGLYDNVSFLAFVAKVALAVILILFFDWLLGPDVSKAPKAP